MTPFWENLMTSRSTTTPGARVPAKTLDGLWTPVTLLEITKAACRHGSWPGRSHCEGLESGPAGNYLSRCQSDYARWVLAHIFTGVKDNPDSQERQRFHKVLANRMSQLTPLDSRQKAFRPIDGCAENIFLLDFLLDFLLSYSRQRHKSSFILVSQGQWLHAPPAATEDKKTVPVPSPRSSDSESCFEDVTRTKKKGKSSKKNRIAALASSTKDCKSD